jgi:hypothetical protein
MWLPDGKIAVFWRARCRITGAEKFYRTHLAALPEFEVMRLWVNEFYRNLDLLEVRPWNPAEDAHRILFPVQKQYVKFKVPVPDLAQPDPRRRSLFVSRRSGARPFGASLLGGRSLLKGA